MLTHPALPKYRSHIAFTKAESFLDLEREIARINSTTAQGEVFEIFAEAYIRMQPKLQCEALWMPGDVPATLRRQYGFKGGVGIDGVFKTFAGEYVPYQVKYRRKASLEFGELTTFFELTKNCQSRLLVTNAGQISPEVLKRSDVITRISFLELTGDQFKCLLSLIIKKTAAVRAVKKPWPYQQAAVSATCRALRTASRANVVLPCGAGKTLISLWTSEALDPHAVLVLCPTLMLLRQTFSSWAANHSFRNGMAAHCLCTQSDRTSNEEFSDLAWHDGAHYSDPQQGSTDLARLRSFLKSRVDRTKVLFSTYQSAFLLGGLPKHLRTFDVGIFDEAHKTVAGAVDAFAFALEDKNVRIKNRIFYTATPRVVQRTNRSSQRIFRSMDDESIYGATCYSMTFREAVELGIVVPYKIAVALVKSVPGKNASAGALSEDGKAEGLVKAVERFGLRKVISFHSTIARASRFAKRVKSLMKKADRDLSVYHLSGKHTLQNRLLTIEEFSSDKRALVTNARALTEGIDVRSIDSVFFSDPKRSLVDIVQAVGRAMRVDVDSGKTRCYVVVPLIAKSFRSKDIVNGVESGGYDALAIVLERISEIDESLRELLREQAERVGVGGGVEIEKFSQYFDLPECAVAPDSFLRCVAAETVRRLGPSWEEMFGAYQAYVKKTGQYLVPYSYLAPNGSSVGSWCNYQRKLRSMNLLPAEREDRLNAVGFSWSSQRQSKVSKYVKALKGYIGSNGHTHVPQKYVDPSGVKLGMWVSRVRLERKRGTVDGEIVSTLDALGFSWDPLAENREFFIDTCHYFKEENGHLDVPRSYKIGDFDFGERLREVRAKLRDGRGVHPDIISCLEELGFEVEPHEASWRKRFSQLEHYKHVNGHTEILEGRSNQQPGSTVKDPLYSWLESQRKRFRSGKLSRDKIKMLQQLGVRLEKKDRFKEQVEELRKFHADFGHFRVPVKMKKLYAFVANLKGGKYLLTPERLSLLKSVGFETGSLPTRQFPL